MVTNYIIIFTSINLVLTYYIPSIPQYNTTLTNLTFGSCFKGSRGYRQDIFNTINKNNPQLFLWLGDAAYVENREYTLLSNFKRNIPFNPDYMKHFNETKTNACT
jgi:hypothetical protein